MTTLSKLPNGLHKDISFEDYIAYDAVNSSTLKEFRRSPLHYLTAKNFQRKQTPALEFGSLVHVATFQPELLDQRYAEMPDINLTTKEGKAAKAEAEAKHPGKTIIKAQEMTAAKTIAAQVRGHTKIKSYLSNAVFEGTLKWELDGIKCKGRLDAYVAPRGIIVDLKTTDNPLVHAFSKTIYQYGYHYQMAWYQKGLRALNMAADYFVLIAVEKTAPYGIRVYELDEAVIEAATIKIDGWLNQYRECAASGKWPCYNESIDIIGLPKWAEEAEAEAA